MKRLLAVPLLVLTLLLLSGIHPEAHSHEHEPEHTEHCHEHGAEDHHHDSDEPAQGEPSAPICACACHVVAADRSVASVPVVEELVFAEASIPAYAVGAVDEPLLDIFHPPKLRA